MRPCTGLQRTLNIHPPRIIASGHPRHGIIHASHTAALFTLQCIQCACDSCLIPDASPQCPTLEPPRHWHAARAGVSPLWFRRLQARVHAATAAGAAAGGVTLAWPRKGERGHSRRPPPLTVARPTAQPHGRGRPPLRPQRSHAMSARSHRRGPCWRLAAALPVAASAGAAASSRRRRRGRQQAAGRCR